ncbi:Ring finger domain [Phytophthora infestans]|uniref:Ring finger domain n=1 Tax=Phytophthora infestans TaxID=4787 RepID=A0A8S9V8I1_PHYIN|nr:Ring finger domain [Phytophthora infestans]
MDRTGSDTERRLRAMEAAFARERQQRDLLEKKYARLKRRYVRLERSHNRLLMENNEKSNSDAQTPTSPTETSQSVDSTMNSRTTSLSVVDLTSPRRRFSSAMTYNNGSQSSVSRGLRSSGLDDICAESPTSSLGSPQESTRESRNSEDQEEKEDTLESWRSNSERTYSSPASRRRLHLDFTLPPSFTYSNRAVSTPSQRIQDRRLHLDQSTTSHTSPQRTSTVIAHSGESRTRTRPRLGHSPERTAARAYGYELEQELEPRTHRHDRYQWASDPSPTPSPVASAATIRSPASRPRAESDEEASLALARYLQQQDNIAAYEEYEARLLRESAQQESNRLAHSSNNLLLSSLAGHQRNIDPDNMTYDELLRLGEEVGDVKKERWRQMAVQVLSSLPTYRWTHGNGEDTCIICQYSFVPNDRAMTLPCAHVFHEDCVGGWIRENNSCPLCKREISPM